MNKQKPTKGEKQPTTKICVNCHKKYKASIRGWGEGMAYCCLNPERDPKKRGLKASLK